MLLSALDSRNTQKLRHEHHKEVDSTAYRVVHAAQGISLNDVWRVEWQAWVDILGKSYGCMQGLLGHQKCKQLGQQALEHAVTQTAGLLPRDLQALAADAAAAAIARGLNALSLLPKLQPSKPAGVPHQIEATAQPDAGPISLFKPPNKRQQDSANGQQQSANGQGADGQQDRDDWQLAAVQFGGIEMCEADVQASLDRVRKRTATVIGAPKVSITLPCFWTSSEVHSAVFGSCCTGQLYLGVHLSKHWGVQCYCLVAFVPMSL